MGEEISTKIFNSLSLSSAHKSTRLFISHCGQKGLNEAIFHGVPVLCIPIFADQGDLALRVVDKELGIQINKEDLTEDRLYNSIKLLLSDKKYVII